MVWIPLGAWIGVLVLAVVVLGYCAYEIIWKTRRLRADLARLNDTTAQVGDLQARLAQVQERLAAAGRSVTPTR